MSGMHQTLPTSSDIQLRDDVCCLERNRAAGHSFEDPTTLFLEPLGMEVWRMRVGACQLSLPSYPQ